MAPSRTETLRPLALAGARYRGLPRLRLLYSPTAEPAAGRVYPLSVGTTYLGRELSAGQDGYSFPGDRAMSSTHSCLTVSESELSVHLRDCESKNGTHIARTTLRRRDESHELADGAILRLGNTLFILRYEPMQPADASIPTLVGVSLTVRELRARIARLAAQDDTFVLISGETGTGKEVVAHALHELSPRRDRPLIAVNCSAIPESLAESELFGHRDNTFTGAKARLGHFRAAHRGTLFLDEVGDMPLLLQPKLFRALQEQSIQPLGSDRREPCEVRVLAATNQDLRARIAAGTFRPELHRRLAQVTVELPPLRARPEDIGPLLQHSYGEIGPHLDADLFQDLLLYSWPENVGQLINLARQIRIEGVSAALRQMFTAPDAGSTRASPAAPSGEPPPPSKRAVRRLKPPSQQELAASMQRHNGIVLRVAEELGCSRRQTQRWLAQYGLSAEDFRRS